MSFLFSSVGWTNDDLDRKVIAFLPHTGSLSCVSKASERLCLARNAGRLCCPTQQFFHPINAELLEPGTSSATRDYDAIPERLVLFPNDDEDDDSNDNMGLSASQFHVKRVKDTWTWSCCGAGFRCTGCNHIAVQDAEKAREDAAGSVAGGDDGSDAVSVTDNDGNDDGVSATNNDDSGDGSDDNDDDNAIAADERPAIAANEREKENALDNRDFHNRDWDESYGGDASRFCTCGYADGLYTYCACGCGYSPDSASF